MDDRRRIRRFYRLSSMVHRPSRRRTHQRDPHHSRAYLLQRLFRSLRLIALGLPACTVRRTPSTCVANSMASVVCVTGAASMSTTSAWPHSRTTRSAIAGDASTSAGTATAGPLVNTAQTRHLGSLQRQSAVGRHQRRSDARGILQAEQHMLGWMLKVTIGDDHLFADLGEGYRQISNHLGLVIVQAGRDDQHGVQRWASASGRMPD